MLIWGLCNFFCNHYAWLYLVSEALLLGTHYIASTDETEVKREWVIILILPFSQHWKNKAIADSPDINPHPNANVDSHTCPLNFPIHGFICSLN